MNKKQKQIAEEAAKAMYQLLEKKAAARRTAPSRNDAIPGWPDETTAIKLADGDAIGDPYEEAIEDLIDSGV